VAPRVSHLPAHRASDPGKIELETLGDQSEDKVLGKLVSARCWNVFNKSFGRRGARRGRSRDSTGGLVITVSDTMPSSEYVRQIGQLPPAPGAVAGSARPTASTAAALEFVLEGLHLSRKLNKDVQPGRHRYRS